MRLLKDLSERKNSLTEYTTNTLKHHVYVHYITICTFLIVLKAFAYVLDARLMKRQLIKLLERGICAVLADEISCGVLYMPVLIAYYFNASRPLLRLYSWEICDSLWVWFIYFILSRENELIVEL